MERRDITKEMERARADFHQLLDSATSAELRAPTHGTKWTNEQLLFHMLFGYLLVRNLLPLVKTLSRLPAGISRGFAAALNAATRPSIRSTSSARWAVRESSATSAWSDLWIMSWPACNGPYLAPVRKASIGACTSPLAGIRTLPTT